jgi:hypothetical protein
MGRRVFDGRKRVFVCYFFFKNLLPRTPAPQTLKVNFNPPTPPTCTAKSQIMTAFLSSSHHASKRSRLSPLCSIEGVAMTMQGPEVSNWPAPLTTLTWRMAKGLPSFGGGRYWGRGNG